MNQIHLPTEKKGAIEETDYMMDFEVEKVCTAMDPHFRRNIDNQMGTFTSTS